MSIFYPDKKRLIEYYFRIIESSDKIGTVDWKSARHDVEMESGNFDSIIRMASEDKNLLEKSYHSLIAVSEYFRFTGQGSIELLEYASKFYNAIDNTRRLGAIHSVIAAVYLLRQEFTKAKSYYNSGLSLATTAKVSLTKANCYAGLGEIEDILGNAEQAESYLKKAIEEYKNTSDLTGRANQIKYLSDIKRGKGDPNFIDLLKEAHDLYVESGDLLGVTNTKRDISEYDKEDLETVLRDAIASYHNLGAAMSEADTRTRLAYQLQAANRNPEAISELDEACKLARMGANSRVEAIAIIVRGVVLRRILDNSWRETMSDGFDLLRKNLTPNAVVYAGYNALENYLIAPDERSRETARELTYQAWKDVGKLDHARVWLETSIC